MFARLLIKFIFLLFILSVALNIFFWQALIVYELPRDIIITIWEGDFVVSKHREDK